MIYKVPDDIKKHCRIFADTIPMGKKYNDTKQYNEKKNQEMMFWSKIGEYAARAFCLKFWYPKHVREISAVDIEVYDKRLMSFAADMKCMHVWNVAFNTHVKTCPENRSHDTSVLIQKDSEKGRTDKVFLSPGPFDQIIIVQELERGKSYKIDGCANVLDILNADIFQEPFKKSLRPYKHSLHLQDIKDAGLLSKIPLKSAADPFSEEVE